VQSAIIAKTKEGLTVHVEMAPPGDTADWRDEEAFRARYRSRGYAVARGLLPADLMDEVVAAFRAEVKPYDGPILRQLTTNMEQHKFSAEGFMTNTILSVQDLVAERFQRFRRSSLEVLTHERVQRTLQVLLGEASKCVESMYFESSARGTITHADCHFMGASAPGEMVAAWYALEDIHPKAGRFYVMPESQLLGTDAPQFSHLKEFYRTYEACSMQIMSTFQDNTLAGNAALRIEQARMMTEGMAGFTFHAPMLQKGDVVFWGSRVLHGSLKPEELHHSRNSLTAHYIGRSRGYLQYGAPVELHLRTTNEMPVHHLRPVRSRARGPQ
jgi:phytanoyl-CoA hydroxylase